MLLFFFNQSTSCGAHLWSPLVLNDNLFFVFCITNYFISSVFFQVDSDLHLGRSCKKKSQKQQSSHIYICIVVIWTFDERCIYINIFPPFLLGPDSCCLAGRHHNGHQREPTATLTKKTVASSCASQTAKQFDQLPEGAI